MVWYKCFIRKKYAGYKLANHLIDAKGVGIGFTIGAIKDSNITKTVLMTAASYGAEKFFIKVGQRAALSLVSAAVLPAAAASVPVAVGVTLAVSTISYFGGDEFYDALGGQHAEDAINELGTIIGESIGDVMNYDWESVYEQGKDSFDSVFDEKINEFGEDLQKRITEKRNSDSEFPRLIDDILPDFREWISDNIKENLYGDAGSLYQNIHLMV